MIAKILAVKDFAGCTIYACPHCRRFVKRARGIKKCLGCYNFVDNDHPQNASGKIIYTGGKSWLKTKFKGNISMEALKD